MRAPDYITKRIARWMLMPVLALMPILLCLLVSACAKEGEIVCYEDITDPEGWWERDTIYLRPDTIALAGTYRCDLNIRTTSVYPYRNFSVIAHINGRKERHTLHFDIANNGTAYTEQQATLGLLTLQRGDSVIVAVKQNMRRETMPGIAGVGLRLMKVGE